MSYSRIRTVMMMAWRDGERVFSLQKQEVGKKLEMTGESTWTARDERHNMDACKWILHYKLNQTEHKPLRATAMWSNRRFQTAACINFR